mgnify:CR=1 FL=1
MKKAVCALALMAGASASVRAQVIITELHQNPPSSDTVWEYIELYGRPGMSLNGYAIACIKGGLDANDDGLPDGSGGDNIPEVDEAFSLDGLALGSNGFLVLYNGTANNSLVPTKVPGSAALADWKNHGVPGAPDVPGNLNDAGSTSIVLVRARQNPVWFAKETLPDLDFDGKADFGDEMGPFYGGTTPRPLQPFQMVDDFAWSSGGGKEYVRTSQQEISETPGFDCDAVSRVAYYIENPARGFRTRDTDAAPFFEVLPTRIADESFVYGEIEADAVFAPFTLAYDNGVGAEGFIRVKGPTDPSGPLYTGACDPEPDTTPVGCGSGGAGALLLFDDVDLHGFALTPGAYNDGAGLFQVRFEAAQAQGSLPGGFSGQFIQRADFDMDGDVDCADVDLIESRIGATLDDRTASQTPTGNSFNDYTWQGAQFQQMLMMLDMHPTDGPGGANAAAVTALDVAAALALVPPQTPCAGDVNGDDRTNAADFTILAGNFGSAVQRCTGGDLNRDGLVNAADFTILAGNFGCQ